MKSKHRLLRRVVTAATALITATSLAVTSFADVWEGVPGGYVNTSYASDSTGLMYGCDTDGFKISWQVSLYVAKSDDGTIDPAVDTIVNNHLGYIGTVTYDNFQDGRKVYLQQIRTTETKDNISAHIWLIKAKM